MRSAKIAVPLRPLSVLVLVAAPSSAQSASPGYCLEEFATVPDLRALARAPEGSAYGSDLYAAVFGSGSVDSIVRIDGSGAVSPFSTLLAEADPSAIEFPPPGSPFGDLLYVAANNRDHGQSSDCGGEIQTVDLAGNWSDLTSMAIGELCNCNTGAPGSAGLGEPEGMAFGPGGAYGFDLFVANATDAPADVMRVAPGGGTSIFVDDGLFSCLGTAGFRPWSVHFDAGGAFGGAMYFADGNAGIRSADATGFASGLFATLPELAKSVRFSPGGDFGTDLYVGTFSSVYRVAPDGSSTLVISGLAGFGFDGLEFSPDGSELFVASAGKVYRVRTCTPASAKVRVACSGVHPTGSFTTPNPPVLGATLEVQIDDPLDETGLPVGTPTGWVMAFEPSLGYPCGVPVGGLGIGFATGELMVLLGPSGTLAQVFVGVGPVWGGPGVPATHGAPIPNAPALSGLHLYAQGFFLDPFDLVLTDGLDLVLGS